MSFQVIDDKSRPLISVNDKGGIAIARYQDMDDECKQYIVETYSELTGEDEDSVLAFLDYKKEENQYCS